MTNKPSMKKTLGLYLHIPFCLSKCAYCDFYSGSFTKEEKDAYVAALCGQLAAVSELAGNYTVDTVYLGGGTPTLLSPAGITTILDAVRRYYHLALETEISAECNPATGLSPTLRAFLAAGVNRLSIGVQSLSDAELRALGRRHTAAEATATIRRAAEIGFSNLSADVMFGIPHQTKERFRKTLEELSSLPLTHLSAYGLRVEEGTPFYRLRETLPLPDEDSEAEMQFSVTEILQPAGFHPYEVSNYAKNGFECRHNLRYWERSPYLGFGPGAHSFFENERFFTPPSLPDYLRLAQSGNFAALFTGHEKIAGKEAADETFMLRMRLCRGLCEAEFKKEFGLSPEKLYPGLSGYIRDGWIKRANGRIFFTPRGMYVSNTILSDLLDFGKEA